MGPSRMRIGLINAAISLAALPAAAQTSRLNHLPPARAPCSVLSGQPCHPSFCGVFHRGPCFPMFEPTLPETLRLTITSTDDNDPANRPSGEPEKNGGDAGQNKEGADAGAGGDHPDDHRLDTIRAMFAALRECWVPPPKDEGRHGMEYTIRFAFKRDGEVVAPPRMTYVSHDAPAAGAHHLSRRHRRGPQALYAAAFQRGHGRRGRRPPDRHTIRRRSYDP